MLGHKQRAASVEKVSANRVRLQWENSISEHGGVLPMTFTARVTLKDGTLTFDSTLDNKSSLSVETIDYPYFGDLHAPTPETPMQAEHMGMEPFGQVRSIRTLEMSKATEVSNIH